MDDTIILALRALSLSVLESNNLRTYAAAIENQLKEKEDDREEREDAVPSK